MALIELLAVLVISLVVLAKASEFVIEHSLVLAHFLRVSELAIGFILLSVATSLPELVVSSIASLQGVGGIAVGNVFGSNIVDLTLVLGAALFFGNIKLDNRKINTFELLAALAATSILPLALLSDELKPRAGLFLLFFFIAFAYLVLKQRITLEPRAERISGKRAVTSAFLFVLGIAVVLLSADYAVRAGVDLANAFGVSKAFIGASLIALGTSLPELAVSVAAVRKGAGGLALGNALGSAVVNLTLVLGVAALLNPLSANANAFLDLILFSLIVNGVLWLLLRFRKRWGKRERIILLLLYALFIASLFYAESISIK